MKIGYFEIYRHIECLDSFCKIFSELNGSDQVSVFTKEIYARELEEKYPNILWFKKTSEKTSDFLEKNAANINSLDILIISTMVIYEDLNYFINFNFKPKIILRIHNINFWFNRMRSIYFTGLFNRFYDSMAIFWKYLIFKGNIYKIKRFLDKVDYYTFCRDVMKDHALRNYPKLKKKTIFTIPLAIPYDGISSKKVSPDMTISIPGYIDIKRRDYQLVYNVLKYIKPKLKKKLIIKLLGKPVNASGYEITEKLKSLSSGNLEIITFNERLNQTDFLNEITDSTILLSPIRVNTHYTLQKEIYGKTKISGIEDDIIRYQKPAILPKTYTPSKIIKPFVYQYNDLAELSDLILQILNDEISVPLSETIYKRIMENKYFSLKYLTEKISSEIIQFPEINK